MNEQLTKEQKVDFICQYVAMHKSELMKVADDDVDELHEKVSAWQKSLFENVGVSLKIKIDEEYQERFQSYLMSIGIIHLRRTKYAEGLFVWKVKINNDMQRAAIEQVSYVKSIELAPLVTYGF